ncbi:hypothetical protein IMZ48_16355, partial [Candidatus Bathyarchaeota archaeon]|nr:hypothetical protein [Candidatus Bathyarchaeota archaeon]
MPSPRRVRLLCMALLACVVITMLWTSHAHHHPPQPLADATAPAPKAEPGATTGEDTKEMAGRLKEAEQKAKDLANSKAPLRPDTPSEVVGVGSSADGKDNAVEGETVEEHEAEQELRTILKRAPGESQPLSYTPLPIPQKKEDGKLTIRSHHLLKVLLPPLQKGKG